MSMWSLRFVAIQQNCQNRSIFRYFYQAGITFVHDGEGLLQINSSYLSPLSSEMKTCLLHLLGLAWTGSIELFQVVQVQLFK